MAPIVDPAYGFKQCRVCGVEKPWDCFYRNNRSPDGLSLQCVPCRLDRQRNDKNRSAYMKEYRQRRKAELAESFKAYASRNVARLQANRKAWRDANRSHIEQYRRDNAAEHDAARKAWNEANKDKLIARTHMRRARLKSAFVGDPAEYLAKVKLIRMAESIACHWCNIDVPTNKRHVDHIIPLSKGGHNTAENICCACVSCNCSKGAKLPHEFKE